ncbi:MAG: hypothetical protein AAB967_01695 [Patescibacteria group bacterium]
MRDNDLIMYRECPFCGATHGSHYVDELEGIVMACRERAAPDKRGTLAEWGDRETLPVRPEIEAFAVPQENADSTERPVYGPHNLDQEAAG